MQIWNMCQTYTDIVKLKCHTDLENWNGTDRHHFNAIVSDQDLIGI